MPFFDPLLAQSCLSLLQAGLRAALDAVKQQHEASEAARASSSTEAAALTSQMAEVVAERDGLQVLP